MASPNMSFRSRSLKYKIILSVLAVLTVLGIGGAGYAALGGFGNNTSSINLNQGLVGWWKLDGNAKDSSAYGNNGSLNGTSTVSDRSGNTNGALSFNGTSDYIGVTNFDHNVMKQTAFSASWSLSIWAKWSGTNANEHILLGKQGCNGGIYTWSNQYQFALKGAGCWTGAQAITATGIADTSKWHLLTATYSNGSMAFYADGVLQGTATLADMTSNYNTTTLGIGSTGNNSYNFSGVLDDARVYNRALSAAEAKALFDQTNPTSKITTGQKGLVGWWKMDGNAKDATPYGNNATPSNATLVADRKGRSNSAYSFDGTATSYLLASNTNTGPYGQLSLFTWVKIGSKEGKQTILNSRSNDAIWFNFDTSGADKFDLYLGNTTNKGYFSTTTTISRGQWTLLGFTYDDSTDTLKLYVNEILDSTISTSGAITLDSDLRFGGAGDQAYYDGAIGDTRLYNRALSSNEVSDMYSSYNSQISLGGSGDSGSVSLGKGLVGYWPFNGNAKDATPFGNIGSPTGPPTLTTDRKGRANSAYSFNGTSQYFNISTSSLPSSAITVSAWANQSTLANWYDLISNYWGGGGVVKGWDFYTSSNGNFQFGLWNSSEGQYNATCATAITAGSWYSLVGTYDGTNVRSYVNGTLCATIAVGGATNIATTQQANFRIGEASAGSSTHSIDDVRIYNRALNANEVKALYESYN